MLVLFLVAVGSYQVNDYGDDHDDTDDQDRGGCGWAGFLNRCLCWFRDLDGGRLSRWKMLAVMWPRGFQNMTCDHDNDDTFPLSSKNLCL